MLSVRQPWNLSLGLLGLALGAYALLSHQEPPAIAALIVFGAGHVFTGLFRDPPPIVPDTGDTADTGPLRATPTGRFRATGWPPSKNPDDYR